MPSPPSQAASPLPLTGKRVRLPARRGGGFYACSTSAYKLNYHETASGLRFVMTTDLAGAAAAPARAAPDSRSAHGSPRQASHASEPRVNPRGAQPATCASHCGTSTFYSHIFVECLVKNPLWKPDDEISCPLFVQNLERYVASLRFSDNLNLTESWLN